MSISETLLSELDVEMAITRKVLERVPTDKGKWSHILNRFPEPAPGF